MYIKSRSQSLLWKGTPPICRKKFLKNFSANRLFHSHCPCILTLHRSVGDQRQGQIPLSSNLYPKCLCRVIRLAALLLPAECLGNIPDMLPHLTVDRQLGVNPRDQSRIIAPLLHLSHEPAAQFFQFRRQLLACQVDGRQKIIRALVTTECAVDIFKKEKCSLTKVRQTAFYKVRQLLTAFFQFQRRFQDRD